MQDAGPQEESDTDIQYSNGEQLVSVKTSKRGVGYKSSVQVVRRMVIAKQVAFPRYNIFSTFISSNLLPYG
jgi:hypothetical protein